ncbi:N-acetylmuramidase domain-containing protein [Yoonia sp. SS1-5]|uniref:N-acetylmuramidase domain-containing protein n=1 Tax=Yoonia rhodophyticola TaxID=3137370 RepID=A0AAN0MCK1_9RHOB
MAFSSDVLAEIDAVAKAEGIEPAALKAVIEVESGGRAASKVDGKLMPIILYEYHVFYRYPGLSATNRKTAVSRKLAARRWGDIPYVKSQSGRYAQLARAAKIDEQAAYAACSWGVGQVLGENAEWLGFGTPKALAETTISGVAGQIAVMLAFVRKSGIMPALENRDWRAFARRYNGPGQVKFYAGRMASAYKRHAGDHWKPSDEGPVTLRIGASGDDVAELQRKLRGLGFHLHVDGDYGPATARMVRQFQAEHGLTADGIAGAATQARIEALSGPIKRE